MKLSIFNLAIFAVSVAAQGNSRNTPAAEKKPPKGGGFGDPHFQTYDGTQYSFHGQCDLVMARSDSFGSGKGLDIHARTDMMDGWSLISNAALRIGNDIFELSNDGKTFFNGKPNAAVPLLLEGQYKVTNDVIDLHGTSETFYTVDLGDVGKIFISLFKGMISVRVEAFLEHTEGMLGIQGYPGMIGRDRGTVLTDPNEMGAQWQVKDTEAMLFHEIKSPQYPEQCILPTNDITSRRRLRAMPDNRLKLAETHCANVKAEMKQFCIDDVLITGDSDMAQHYAYSF